tara:strand:- start:172 stop:396 length:225 start_codon:yes stop_codon:yes gene_type:complete
MSTSEYSTGDLVIIDRFMLNKNKKNYNVAIYLGDYYFVTGNRFAKVLFDNEIIEVPYSHLKKVPENVCAANFKQ